ncbi:MAG: hypothetical protein Q9170_005440 [Blastenia crenularia]
MADNRQLRQKNAISYEVSSDSNDEPASVSSAFGSPQKLSTRKKSVITLDEETESDEDESLARTPPPRLSTAGHSLRQHNHLRQSLRAQENGDKSTKKKQSKKTKRAIVTSDAPKSVPVRSERKQIRDTIATSTVTQRNNFFIAHKDLFIPLLPKKNHITNLVEQRRLKEPEDDILAISDSLDSLSKQNTKPKDPSVPYEDLSRQPRGIEASMKPYQLSGLSFLVYLHRNGLSGILGDEMGLGKTLQTLSLIQYLKENRKLNTISEQRPSLVVCPLSVLSSWIAEARKWAPGLKVLRFHGPLHERDRMKRVAMGEIDLYGQETKRHKAKRNDRMTKAGKIVIDIDAQPETENEIGVDLVVTTYECFQAEHSWFKRAFIWKYVILDEGHKIKNNQTQISRALQALSAEYRLILTGTPLHNNMLELWGLLHWLYPEIFTEKTAEAFKNAFDLTKGTVSTQFMDDARRLLERVMLRRMKSSPEVNLNLPPKTEVLLYIPLTPMQRFFYTRLMTRADQGLLDELFQDARQKEAESLQQDDEEKMLQGKNMDELQHLEKTGNQAWLESKEILQKALEQEQQDESKTAAWKKLMNLLMQLRKVCNHPYLLPHVEPDPYYIGEHIVHASGKLIVLDKLLNELVTKQKKKVLIFSEFTRMLDCCEDFLALRGGNGSHFKYLRLQGSTGRARRNLCIRLFNQEDSGYEVMLISTRAGGLGINLTAASDVVMMDQNWNPQVTLQAEARAHRIGQTKPVTIYKLCTQGTVEEQMLGRISKKLYLSAKVTESMHSSYDTRKINKAASSGTSAADDDMPQLNTSQLMSLVRRGARALAHPEIDINDMLQWDWPTMLENCKDKPADAIVAKDTGVAVAVKEDEEQKWLEQVEHVHSRVFQGKKYAKEKEDYNSIAEDWSTRADRRVGKETTVMVDGFAISKQSISCGVWEAVPTLAGKDPRLAEPKREKKAAIQNQEICQVCWDGGDLVLCSGCPRSYHYDCLDPTSKSRSRATLSFHCSQHQCWDCAQKTSDAGGMLFRCRWCSRGFCEDCLDWDKTELIGENLKEYELLQYPSVTQAFYVCCHVCTEQHASNPVEKAFCDEQAAETDTNYRLMLEENEAKAALSLTPSDAQSLTDASTIDDSAVATPRFSTGGSSKRKRKAASASFGLDMTTSDDPSFAISPCESDKDSSFIKIKRKIPPGSKKITPSKRSKLSLSSSRTPFSRGSS